MDRSELIKAFGTFSRASVKLSEELEKNNFLAAEDYPLQESFDEIAAKLSNWASTQARILGQKTLMKWYVIVDTAPDGKDYVGINDESYWGDGDIVSEYGSQDAAEAASIKYAQEQGLPLFADYKER